MVSGTYPTTAREGRIAFLACSSRTSCSSRLASMAHGNLCDSNCCRRPSHKVCVGKGLPRCMRKGGATARYCSQRQRVMPPEIRRSVVMKPKQISCSVVMKPKQISCNVASRNPKAKGTCHILFHLQGGDNLADIEDKDLEGRVRVAERQGQQSHQAVLILSHLRLR